MTTIRRLQLPSGRFRPWLVTMVLPALALQLGAQTPPADAPAPKAPPPPAAASTIPAQISDADFWRMINEFSEPGGYFRSDNLVGNELTLQEVIPSLTKETSPNGVYLGVGPDQNFTYIAALQPKIAFIVDIRRQNMLQHLLYKALFEQSKDRADFLSKLFSRARPAGLDTTSSAAALFRAFRNAPPDTALFRKNLAAVKTLLVDQKKFTLSVDDLAAIEFVYSAFQDAGPDLTYNYPRMSAGGYSSRRMPTYEDLMVSTDGYEQNRGYLGNEANFRVLANMQRKNLIVPVVGDFGGPKALRAVGKYLKDNRATVTAFYLSNVEQYLFQGEAWRSFFSNVATLPVDSSSTFLRAVFNMGGMRTTAVGARSVTLRASIADQVKAYEEGRIMSYYDVVLMSR
jgi:hypothetical protein